MKKINHSVLTIVIALALCCAMLAGCSQKVSQFAEAASPAAAGTTNEAAASVDTDAAASATAGAVDATSSATVGETDATSSATVGETDATSSATVKDGKGTPSAPAAGTTGTDIGAEEAKSIALKHAGVAASEVTFAKAEKDNDDGRWVYEVEFYSQNKEYDYEIDASTGTILNYDHDTQHSAKPASKPAAGTTGADIGAEEAKSIALKHAGVAASEVTFARAEKDNDDGRWVYEVEFYSQNKEYDYEIDASTGAILSYDHDAEYYTKPTANAGSNTNYIGIEKAKAIALNHAGLSASKVSFSKAKFEDDHGRKEYEVEFYCDGTEYEYTIDASSGSIVEYDSDRDN